VAVEPEEAPEELAEGEEGAEAKAEGETPEGEASESSDTGYAGSDEG
jgi:hypothetical protein